MVQSYSCHLDYFIFAPETSFTLTNIVRTLVDDLRITFLFWAMGLFWPMGRTFVTPEINYFICSLKSKKKKLFAK